MQRKKVFFFDFRKLLDTAMPLRVPFSPRLTPAQQAPNKRPTSAYEDFSTLDQDGRKKC